jgi:hypothetical protein
VSISDGHAYQQGYTSTDTDRQAWTMEKVRQISAHQALVPLTSGYSHPVRPNDPAIPALFSSGLESLTNGLVSGLESLENPVSGLESLISTCPQMVRSFQSRTRDNRKSSDGKESVFMRQEGQKPHSLLKRARKRTAILTSCAVPYLTCDMKDHAMSIASEILLEQLLTYSHTNVPIRSSFPRQPHHFCPVLPFGLGVSTFWSGSFHLLVRQFPPCTRLEMVYEAQTVKCIQEKGEGDNE